ncbi:hypothetical protein [Rathayibacter soli]|uniref:hypothetical protein n=1 Tax=Rathayibacter soli TaxID=3144168 RepID=UPI0027E59534|nr:hypothetical protein [Glaciibacter superstes]
MTQTDSGRPADHDASAADAGATGHGETGDGATGDGSTDAVVFDQTITPERVRIKRTPRYGRFILVAVLVCAAAAFILTYSFPQGQGYDRTSVFGYMLLVAIAVGVVLGALVALLADRITSRRAATVVVDRIDVTERADADAGADAGTGANADAGADAGTSANAGAGTGPLAPGPGPGAGS